MFLQRRIQLGLFFLFALDGFVIAVLATSLQKRMTSFMGLSYSIELNTQFIPVHSASYSRFYTKCANSLPWTWARFWAQRKHLQSCQAPVKRRTSCSWTFLPNLPRLPLRQSYLCPRWSFLPSPKRGCLRCSTLWYREGRLNDGFWWKDLRQEYRLCEVAMEDLQNVLSSLLLFSMECKVRQSWLMAVIEALRTPGWEYYRTIILTFIST